MLVRLLHPPEHHNERKECVCSRSRAPWRAVCPFWLPANKQARPITEGGRSFADRAHLEENNNKPDERGWKLAVCRPPAPAIAVCHDTGASAPQPSWRLPLMTSDS